MIDVSEGLRQQFDKQVRQDIDYEAVISLLDKNTIESIGYDLQNTSELDDICFTSGLKGVDWTFDYFERYNFLGFADFEQNTYDTLNPKRLFREPTAQEAEYILDYASMYASRVYSKQFYTNPTTEESPFFQCDFNAIDFSFPITGVTITFGEEATIYPTKIVLEFYDSANSKIDTVYGNPSSVYYTLKKKVENVSKIRLKVLEMSRLNVKFRMSSFLLGYEQSFKNDLISIQCKRSSNPLSTELPKNTVEISVFDFNGIFDPQNPNGIYFLLLDADIQIHCTYMGIRNLLGTYNAYESPNSSGNTVSFSGESIGLGELQRFDAEIFGFNGMSLYDFMYNDIFPIQSVQTNFSVDVPMYSVPRNYEYVKEKPQKAYSKVANCLFGIFIEDKQGNITLKPSLKPNEKPSKIIPLKEELICGEIKVDTSTPVPSGIKINLYEESTGNKLYSVGEGNFIVDNNYIVGEDIANYMIDTYNWWVDGTQKYEIPYMANPTIEIGDFVKFKNKYGVELVGIVAENNYSLPTSPGTDTLVIYTVGADKE